MFVLLFFCDKLVYGIQLWQSSQDVCKYSVANATDIQGFAHDKYLRHE
jgi:hypothetical protein